MGSSKYNRYQKSLDNIKNNKGNKNMRNNSNRGVNKNSGKCSDDTEILDLDSTKNLDISFLDGKFNMKKASFKTSSINIDDIKRAEEEFSRNLISESKYRFMIIIIVLLTISCFSLVVFIGYHFFSFDHSMPKEKRVVEKVKVVDDNYLFLGDSITYLYDLDKYYENLPVINSGISGYTTQTILDNINSMAYRYNPSKVFLLIGTNDLAVEASNQEVIDNIEKIIDGIKESRPYAKIYLESIYPINNSDDEKIADSSDEGRRNNNNIREVNEGLKALAKREKVTYIDLYSELIDDNGMLDLKYTTDGLHISNEGYKVITSVLMKCIYE